MYFKRNIITKSILHRIISKGRLKRGITILKISQLNINLMAINVSNRQFS